MTSITVNPVSGDVCYPAGCFLVVYSPKDNKQNHFLKSRKMRPWQSVSFSMDGKYLVAGEAAFNKPEITIWEISYSEANAPKIHSGQK